MAGKYPPRTTLTKPHLMLCEGPGDEAFFRALAVARGLPEFCIRHPGDSDQSPRGGIDKFGDLLDGIQAYTGFHDVSKILIVADNDLEPQTNLDKVRAQIEATQPFGTPPRKYGVPTAPLETVVGPPSITILMVPWAKVPGNLETLCLPAAMSVPEPVPGCVDQFAGCVGATAWAEPNLAKLKLRSALAAGHKPDPFISLGNVWKNKPELIPLNHACFNPVADVLATFLA